MDKSIPPLFCTKIGTFHITVLLFAAALGGSEMRQTLEAFRRVKAHTDDKFMGRDRNASKSETLVPSVAVVMALPTATQAALPAVVSDFWNNDGMPVVEAMARPTQASIAKK